MIAQSYKKFESRWHDAVQNIKQVWERTPTRDVIYHTSRLITGAKTNLLVADACIQFLGAATTCAYSEAMQCARIIKEQMPAFPQVIHTPAVQFLHEHVAVMELTRVGKELGFAIEDISQTLINVESEAVKGNKLTLNKAIKSLENKPGFKSTIRRIFDHGPNQKELNRVKGPYFEIESALQLQQAGHEIIGLNLKIFNHEFDIVTNLGLFECKNWDWEYYIKNGETFRRFLDQLSESKILANKIQKPFLLKLKNDIPIELNWLREKITNLDIIIITE